jgi:capsular polysaccharide export protein
VNELKTIHAVGFPLWKRRHVRAFLGQANVRFVRSATSVPPGGIAATWGLRIPEEQFPVGVPVWRLEDGFLRSVGLGADLTRPLSWVVDKRGIYYDPSRPSDLEYLLAHHPFSAGEKDRARALRKRINDSGITKYNCDTATWRRPASAKRAILVPGQVETDASIRLGTNGISSNIALLKAVRQSEPDAFIIYKPHPDVAAGLRRRAAGEAGASEWCDAVVGGCSMHALLGQIDEVHTITSLTGFEALLRGVKVITYGTPFYAGWRLTEDRDIHAGAMQRRNRHICLDELVAACLVSYPKYADRRGQSLPGPEQAIDELIAWRRNAPREQPLLRPLLRMFKH